MQGYLYEKKTGIISTGYKKYWFSLENDCLLKFKNVKFEMIETIELRNFKSVCTMFSKESKKVIVLMDHNDNSRYLYFEGENDAYKMWIQLISNAIANIKSNLVKEKFDLILKVISDACIVTNDKFNILEVNSHLENLTGYCREDLLSKSIRIFMMDYYSKFYDELFNHKKKSDKITRKILICNNNSKKIPVSVTINEYIINEIMKKVYIFTFKSIDNSESIQVDLIDTKPNSYVAEFVQIINEQAEKSKKLVIEQYEKIEKVVQSYEQKLRVMEEENKNLIKSNKELIKNIKELENNLNYFKRKSGQATLFNILSQDSSRLALKEFCKENKTEENLLFWEDVTKFKTKYLSNANLICEEIPYELRRDIENIYSKYIAQGSKYEINISDKMREDIRYQMDNEIDLYNIFDKSLYDILQLMNSDVYPIFCSTQAGRRAISLFN